MAGLKKKLKGSTLVEVLVAMVIILASLGATMIIFTNLSRDINDELRILAEIQMNTIATETKLKRDFTDTSLEFENLRIQRTILSHPQKTRIKILHLEAFTPLGKSIAQYKELITVTAEKR